MTPIVMLEAAPAPASAYVDPATRARRESATRATVARIHRATIAHSPNAEHVAEATRMLADLVAGHPELRV